MKTEFRRHGHPFEAARPFPAGKLSEIGALTSLLLSACAGPGPPTADDVRLALAGHRHVRPALGRLEIGGACTTTDDFIPVTRCGEPPDPAELGTLARALAGALRGAPTPESLHASALLSLAPGPSGQREAQYAVVYLREALEAETDASRRAGLLTDLSAAHLVHAEVSQSPLEAAAGLEAALRALEIELENRDARFNQTLAQILLGIDPPGSVTEPALRDLARVLEAGSIENPRHESPCMSARAIGLALDAWSESPSDETWAPLAEELSCSDGAEDRFFPDLLAAAAADPEPLARSWLAYRAANRAFAEFDTGRLNDQLEALEGLQHPTPVRLAVRFLEAMVPYMADDHDRATSEALLRAQAREAEARAYFGLAAVSRRLMAVIAELRGDYGHAMDENRQAAELARRAGSPEIEAAVEAQRVDLLELAGREVEGWRTLAEALRGLDPTFQAEARASALETCARLARERGFERVALHLSSRAVALSENSALGARLGALRSRGEMRAQLGQLDLARDDLDRARQLLDDAPEGLFARKWLEADLDLLEGLVAPAPEVRRAALTRAFDYYRTIEYDRRILTAQLALARAEKELGDVEAAFEILRDAFDELADQVDGAGTWAFATALVAAARPVADELIGLQLDHGEPSDVLATIGRYLGLRSGSLLEAAYPPDFEGQRLTTFVRSEEVLLLVEARGSLSLARRQVPRETLEDLRELLLAQLSAGVPEPRIRATLSPLARHLLDPIAGRLREGGPLVIVADDVLAGLPFILLPLADAGGGDPEEILLDRFTVSYATDLRPMPVELVPRVALTVGASGDGSGLLSLPYAEPEARAVGGAYVESHILSEDEATPDALLKTLADVRGERGIDVLHVASHFVVNTRSPLESELVLSGTDPHLRRLTLRHLLAEIPRGFGLLYLSACETGRGLPTAAHGLHSLAQAFTAAGVDRTLLTLWRLDDETGADIAPRFHRFLNRGTSAAEALRTAQLEHRDEHPASWAALALYH